MPRSVQQEPGWSTSGSAPTADCRLLHSRAVQEAARVQPWSGRVPREPWKQNCCCQRPKSSPSTARQSWEGGQSASTDHKRALTEGTWRNTLTVPGEGFLHTLAFQGIHPDNVSSRVRDKTLCKGRGDTLRASFLKYHGIRIGQRVPPGPFRWALCLRQPMPDISPGHGQAHTQMTTGGNSVSSLQIFLWVERLQHAPVIENMMLSDLSPGKH